MRLTRMPISRLNRLIPLSLFILFLCVALPLASVYAQGHRSSGFFAESGTFGDPDASYLQLSTSTDNQNERVFTPDATDFTATDNGAGNTYTLELNTVPLTKGGTGATTQQGAVDAILNFGSLATGDITYRGASNWSRLGIGSTNDVLTVIGGVPVWQAPALGIGSNLSFVTATSEASLSNERVLTGTANKITVTDNSTTIDLDIGTDITQNTATQTLTNKTYTAAIFPWDSGNGFTLKGQASDATIDWADWAATRALTIPDPGGDADFVMTAGNQTLAGTKTFSTAPTLTSGTLTAGANLQTFPSTAQTLVGRSSTDTLTNKTLTSPIISSNSMTLKQTTADITLDWANPAAGRNYTIPEVATDADFGMTEAGMTYTAGGSVYTHNGTMKTTAAGTSGQALVSAGTSAPGWGTLPIVGGGTNNPALGVSAVGIYHGDGSKLTQTTASALESWRVNSGGTAIEAFTPGTVTSVGNSISGLPITAGSAVTSSGNISLTAQAAAGDIIYGSATNVYSRLTKGTDGQVLTLASGLPSWADASGGQSFFRAEDVSTTLRTFPTTGTIDGGTYVMNGDWQSTGNIVISDPVRIYINGSFTLDHTITMTPLEDAPTTENTTAPGPFVAQGLGGGAQCDYGGGAYGCGGGGAGGPANTDGGKGGSVQVTGAQGGRGYDYTRYPYGSSGAQGMSNGSGNDGGKGGGGGSLFYLEATGAIDINETITCDGEDGGDIEGTAAQSGGGGAGSGGVIIIKGGSTFDLASTKELSADGGDGGAGDASWAGAGGGGAGGFIKVTVASTLTNNGTFSVSGGAAGTPSNNTYQTVAAGSSGSSVSEGSTNPISELNIVPIVAWRRRRKDKRGYKKCA